MKLAALAVAGVAGCASFPDPDIVVDLRVISMTADVSEQAVTVDLAAPDPAAVLAQLQPTGIHALVADPGLDRSLRWQLTVCPFTDSERCDPDDPQEVIGAGLVADPDTTEPEPAIDATLPADATLASVLEEALSGDTLDGLGGIYYEVQLRVGGQDADPTLDQYAAKTLAVMPKVPATVTSNANPSLTELDAAVDGVPVGAISLGRCVDQLEPLTVLVDSQVQLTPVEAPGARETYVAPTLDGVGATETESLEYQWLATGGGYEADLTGGPPDVFGNVADLFTDWDAPDDPADVTIWIIQRDERYGEHWYETCVRVVTQL
ncbi:MAG TPA: hypothetical protein VGM88_13805 [Kofleriaceae bacterium]